MLGKYDITVDVAENGEIGLNMFKESKINKYDLVFMDIQMPIMNGYETTEAIRKLDREDNNIPIRHLSGHISLTEKDVPNIKKLYKEGISIYRIATKYKVSKQCMYNFLYKYNIKENINIPRVSRP